MVDIQAKLKEIGPFVEGADDNLLVCRCEEVTKGQIRKAVHEGIFTLEEMRRYLRISVMVYMPSCTALRISPLVTSSHLQIIRSSSGSGLYSPKSMVLSYIFSIVFLPSVIILLITVSSCLFTVPDKIWPSWHNLQGL